MSAHPTPEGVDDLRELMTAHARVGGHVQPLPFWAAQSVLALLGALDEAEARLRHVSDACHWSHVPDDVEALVAYIAGLQDAQDRAAEAELALDEAEARLEAVRELAGDGGDDDVWIPPSRLLAVLDEYGGE